MQRQENFQSAFKYKTRKFDLDIFYKSGFVDVEDVTVEKERFSKVCKEGCRNHSKNWACPPNSPSFSGIKKDYKRLFVYTAYIRTGQINIEKPYLLLFNIYNILAPRMYKTGLSLEKELGGLLLKSGGCRACKSCALKQSKGCANPEKRRYALESVGVNVEELVKNINHKLLWYDKKNIPDYVSIVNGILANKEIDQANAFESFRNSFNK